MVKTAVVMNVYDVHHVCVWYTHMYREIIRNCDPIIGLIMYDMSIIDKL